MRLRNASTVGDQLSAMPVARPARALRRLVSGIRYEQGRKLAARADVTAVFAGNDQMAMGILRAFHEAGREIPGDVSVVGFDDVPEAEFQMVPLTTVGVDADEAAQRILDELLKMIEGAAPPSDAVTLPGTKLIIRALLVLLLTTAAVRNLSRRPSKFSPQPPNTTRKDGDVRYPIHPTQVPHHYGCSCLERLVSGRLQRW